MRYAGEKKLNIWVAMALGILALFLLFVVYPWCWCSIKAFFLRTET